MVYGSAKLVQITWSGERYSINYARRLGEGGGDRVKSHAISLGGAGYLGKYHVFFLHQTCYSLIVLGKNAYLNSQQFGSFDPDFVFQKTIMILTAVGIKATVIPEGKHFIKRVIQCNLDL